MSAYRFCRTDDIGLLVDALNRCSEQDPPMTAAAFKRSIRDLQVWCSSCMVAFAGADPIGVLIGAKRPTATLIHHIAVHPDHQRQGHGLHLLASLSSKLAILGPPRIVAEVPQANAAAQALFRAGGYVEDALLTDYVADDSAVARNQREPRSDAGRIVIPVTVDDLAANGLLEGGRQVCWERSIETLSARKDDLDGLAVASEESIEAYVLYIKDAGSIVALNASPDDAAGRLGPLFSRLAARGERSLRFPKVHPAEIPPALLETLGFRAAGRHVVFAATARSG